MNTDRKRTSFRDISGTWLNDELRKARDAYFVHKFFDGYVATMQPHVPAWKRAWWRVREFLRSFVYVECECGAEINRWNGAVR